MSVSPDENVVNLADPAMWQDPHPVLRAALARGPVARCTPFDVPMLLSFEAVRSGIADPRLEMEGVEFLTRQGISEGPLYDWWGLGLLSNNPPVHTRLRTLVGRAFTPRRVAAMRPRIRAMANDLVDRVVESGRMEIVEEYAHEIPVRTISALLGVPQEDVPQFSLWSTQLGLAFSPVIPPELRPVIDEAVTGLWEYSGRLIEERRARPRDDLVSALIQAETVEGRLSEPELKAMIVGLLFAGHDTTKGLISIGTWLLLRHGDQLETLREDPARIPSAIEEIVRYEPMVFGTMRRAREPFSIEGFQVEAGQTVFLSLLAANRDPSRFPDPDRFDVARDTTGHLAFGNGVHFCLGASLARVEGEEALRVLLERLPAMRTDVAAPAWVPFAGIRRFEALPVRFDPGPRVARRSAQLGAQA